MHLAFLFSFHMNFKYEFKKFVVFGADSRIMNAQRWKLAEHQHNKPGYCRWHSCLQIQ
jgi:hypothetical protein